MIWLDNNQNHILKCQSDVVMSFVKGLNKVRAWSIVVIYLLSQPHPHPAGRVLVCDHEDVT